VLVEAGSELMAKVVDEPGEGLGAAVEDEPVGGGRLRVAASGFAVDGDHVVTRLHLLPDEPGPQFEAPLRLGFGGCLGH
jgi:hypothetical protein